MPGVAQVATQERAQAARSVVYAIKSEPLQPFPYCDYGTMAVMGRRSAVVDVWPMETSGFFAWLFWLFSHIFWLTGFCDWLAVMSGWASANLAPQRRVRLIAGERLPPAGH